MVAKSDSVNGHDDGLSNSPVRPSVCLWVCPLAGGWLAGWCVCACACVSVAVALTKFRPAKLVYQLAEESVRLLFKVRWRAIRWNMLGAIGSIGY